MAIIIENGTLYLPENLYDSQGKSVIRFHELQLELRNLDIYMGQYTHILINDNHLINQNYFLTVFF